MKMSIRGSLRGKLTLLFLLLSLLPFLIVAIISYNHGRRMLADTIGAKLHEVAQGISNNIDYLIRFRIVDVKSWAELNIMQDILIGDPDGRISSFLARTKESYRIYRDIYCVNPEGKIVASSDPAALARSVADLPWFKKAVSGSLNVTEVYPYESGKGLVMGIASPVYSSFDKDKIIGVLYSMFDWQVIFDELDKVLIDGKPQSKKSYITMLNKDGLVLSKPAFDKEKREGVLNKNLIEMGLKSAKLATLSEDKGQKKEKGWLVELNEYKEKALIGYATSKGFKDFGVDWSFSILVVKSLKEAYAPIRLLQINISLIGTLVLVLVILVVNFSAGKFTAPILNFVDMAKTIAEGEGDLSKTFKVVSKDEIGQLASAFNQLVAGLNSIVRQIRSTADKVASSSQGLSSLAQQMNVSAKEISSATEEVAKGITSQSKRMEETYKISEEMSDSLKQVVANTQRVATGAEQATKRAELGKQATTETVKKINFLTDTVNDAVATVDSLGKMSQEIGTITETITQIADQINLLALNAAIEAARAGEAGRGFAVVAEEVRKLAENSSDAVKKIDKLIKSSQSETNRVVSSIRASSKEAQEGKALVQEVAKALAEIDESIQQTAVMAAEISAASQQQLKSTEQVVKVIDEVFTISKESTSAFQEITSSIEEQTASMQEMSTSSQELARLAGDLKEAVGRFILKEE